MRKFNLFSRSALTSMAAAAGLVSLDGGEKPAEKDPEAGPASDEGEEGVDDASDTGEVVVLPEDKPAGEPKPEVGAVDVVSVVDANAHAADQFAAGCKAERDRTTAVLGSDAGKANMTMAAWMLSSSPNASADEIVAQLKTMPVGATVRQSIPDTNVDIGRGDAAAAQDDAPSGDAAWAAVQGTADNKAPVVASDASRATIAALAAGAKTVSTGGNALPTPAVAPTGY